MTPDQRDRVDRICLALLDVPIADRARLLDELCRGELDMRREVETLLAGQGAADELLRTPPPGGGRAAVETLVRDSLAGRSLGPYRLETPIDSGGMGIVYRAHDTKLDRPVALKVLPPEVAADPDRLARFAREARLLAALNHPSVLTVHDVGAADGIPYVVTELLEGETVREAMLRRQPTPRQVLALAAQAAQGLAAAHRQGIVHRDLKPENLFLTIDGRVKILDFGLAKRAPASPAPSDGGPGEATHPGLLIGTVAYMAPEQVNGEPVDARADVFAFGVVLYEWLTRRHPFRRDTLAATFDAILRESPPPPATVVPAISPAISDLVDRCLAKPRDLRYRDGDDLARALAALVEATPGGPRRLEPRSPYPGLRAFTERDAHAFVGREAEVAALWERIRVHRLLAVIGPSGAGKTSFLHAGVLPARPEGWAAMACTPGPSPMRGLGQALAPAIASDPDLVARLVAFDDPDVAFALLRRWRERHAAALLVVDQFEELFTLNLKDAQTRFATLLGRLVSEADIHVVLALRDDFLIHCCEQPPLAPVLSQLTALLPPDRDALQRALVEPAAALGYRFEPESLAGEMVAEVEGTRAPLPLLAFAVSRLWERRERDRACLTREAYLDIGGVAGALAQHAEETLQRIGAGREPIVREFFRNLVTSQGTRVPAGWEELLSVAPDRAAAEAVLRELVDARLLTSYEVAGTAGRPAEHRVEVAHESLLTAWPRLTRWRSQDEDGARLRDQVKQAARLWDEKERSADLLWSGTAYREFALWRDRSPAALTAVEQAFAAAMTAKARRRTRVAAAATGVAFLVVLAVAAAIAVSRQRAVASARQAEASQLLAMAEAAIQADPSEALAYVTASLEVADTTAAREFVVRVLYEAPPAREFETGLVDSRVPAFSPGGSRLAVGGHSASVGVWPDAGGAPVVLDGHQPSPMGPNVGQWAREDLLVTGPEPELARRLQVWSLPTGARRSAIELDSESRWTVVGDRVLAVGARAGRPSAVRAWSLPDGTEVSPTAADRTGWGNDSSMSTSSPDGRWTWRLALNDPQASVWMTTWPAGARPIALRRSGSWYGSAGAMHPMGTWFAATTNTMSAVTMWPLPARPVLVIDGYRTLSRPLAFSADGRWLATNWEGYELRLWPVPPTATAPPRALDAPRVQWRTLAFDPRGRHLFAVGHPDQAWLVPLDGSPGRQLWQSGGDAMLHGVAVSPSGRLVATASYFGGRERWLRVFDVESGHLRTFPLPSAPHGALDPSGGYDGAVTNIFFDGETRLFTAGLGGLRRWALEDGSSEDVGPADPYRHSMMWMTADRRTAFVATQGVDGRTPCVPVERVDLAAATRTPLPEFGGCASIWGPHGAGDVLAVPNRDGTIRVGRPGQGVPHILAGHAGAVAEVAVSPDLRWVASSGEDNTLRLWPMPDLSAPPLHVRSRDELLATLRSLTNIRAVRDASSPTGWRIALAPFPGWREAPAW